MAVESSQRAVIMHYGAPDTAIGMGDVGILACVRVVGRGLSLRSVHSPSRGSLSVSAVCRGGVPHPAAERPGARPVPPPLRSRRQPAGRGAWAALLDMPPSGGNNCAGAHDVLMEGRCRRRD